MAPVAKLFLESSPQIQRAQLPSPPFGGGIWPCRNRACSQLTTALHVLAPLSRAVDDLKSSSADTVVFPEPHVSSSPFRQFCLNYPYDVDLGCFIRATPVLATRRNTVPDQSGLFEAWPLACRSPRTKDSKDFDCCKYAGIAISWEDH